MKGWANPRPTVPGQGDAVRYTPTLGATIVVAPTTSVVVIDPAGVLALLTIQYPNVADGWEVQFFATRSITVLNHTNAGTPINAPLALVAPTYFTMKKLTALLGGWARCA